MKFKLIPSWYDYEDDKYDGSIFEKEMNPSEHNASFRLNETFEPDLIELEIKDFDALSIKACFQADGQQNPLNVYIELQQISNNEKQGSVIIFGHQNSFSMNCVYTVTVKKENGNKYRVNAFVGKRSELRYI